jgi:hypothetical protein
MHKKPCNPGIERDENTPGLVLFRMRCPCGARGDWFHTAEVKNGKLRDAEARKAIRQVWEHEVKVGIITKEEFKQKIGDRG